MCNFFFYIFMAWLNSILRRLYIYIRNSRKEEVDFFQEPTIAIEMKPLLAFIIYFSFLSFFFSCCHCHVRDLSFSLALLLHVITIIIITCHTHIHIYTRTHWLIIWVNVNHFHLGHRRRRQSVIQWEWSI